MSFNLNKVCLGGRLTRDPELAYTPTGTAVCKFSVVTNRYGKSANGEKQEFAEFSDIVVWNNGTRTLADLCAQYLEKGKVVYVEGRLQTRSWDDKETGAKRSRTEVVAHEVQFLSPRGEQTDLADGDVDPASIPF